MTRKEFFQANPKATFEDYKAYLSKVIQLTLALGRLPTDSEVEETA